MQKFCSTDLNFKFRLSSFVRRSSNHFACIVYPFNHVAKLSIAGRWILQQRGNISEFDARLRLKFSRGQYHSNESNRSQRGIPVIPIEFAVQRSDSISDFEQFQIFTATRIP